MLRLHLCYKESVKTNSVICRYSFHFILGLRFSLAPACQINDPELMAHTLWRLPMARYLAMLLRQMVGTSFTSVSHHYPDVALIPKVTLLTGVTQLEDEYAGMYMQMAVCTHGCLCPFSLLDSHITTHLCMGRSEGVCACWAWCGKSILSLMVNPQNPQTYHQVVGGN